VANKDTLTLPISKATQKKLRALAMLTEANVGNIEEELAGYLDRVITERCIELLGGAPAAFAEGVTYPITEKIEEIPVIKKGKMNGRSFAAAQEKFAGGRSEETEAVEEAFSDLQMEDEISGHELSSDEDPQDNKSLEEEVDGDKEEEAELKQAFNGRRIPNVEDNAEAFLEAAMGEPEERETDEIPTVTRGYAGVGNYGTRPVTATKSFESRFLKGKKAHVQPYTGDEE
jgi:hypothetical protein